MSGPATWPPGDEVYDAVVVGAGPAGSMTALELAGCGASVLLVERSAFPRAKVCGCCVNPRALGVLRDAGLGDLAVRLGAVPLEGITLGCAGRRATLRHPLGVAVSRAAFDDALAAAARDRGAQVLTETTALLVPASAPGERSVLLRREGIDSTVRARSVVSAAGLSDSLRERGGEAATGHRRLASLALGPRIGAGTIAPEVPEGYAPGQIFMACGTAGYVGLVVLEDGRLDIAAALCPRTVRRRGGIGPVAEGILAEARFPAVPGLAELPWKGTPVLTRNPRAVAERGLFRVGDAAGYVEPFTGEGIGWALAGGRALAGLLVNALDGNVRAPERSWIEAHRCEVTRTQLACRVVRLALRAPWITRTLVRILDLHPSLARPLLSSLHQTRLARPARRPGPWPRGLDR